MKPFRAQRGAKIFDFRFTFLRKLKHFRAQRGAKCFDFSSIRAKNNFELTFHNSFIAHHAPGIINNFFHNGKPSGRINYYYERARSLQYSPLSHICVSTRTLRNQQQCHATHTDCSSLVYHPAFPRRHSARRADPLRLRPLTNRRPASAISFCGRSSSALSNQIRDSGEVVQMHQSQTSLIQCT